MNVTQIRCIVSGTFDRSLLTNDAMRCIDKAKLIQVILGLRLEYEQKAIWCGVHLVCLLKHA